MLNRISFRQRQRNSGSLEHRVELVEPRADASAALESSERPPDLVLKLAGFAVAVLFDFPVRLRRHDRRHAQGLHDAAGLVALVGAVHRRRRVRDRLPKHSNRTRPSGTSWACPPDRQKIIAWRLLAETIEPANSRSRTPLWPSGGTGR